jgi:Na+/phosphate symporter
MSKLKTALDLVPEKVEKLIKDYSADIEEAWLKREEKEDLTVSFSAKFSVEKGSNICDVSVSFTPTKIKDHIRFAFDEKQGNLPGIGKSRLDKDKAKKEGLLPKDKK